MSVTMKKETTCWTFGVGVGAGVVDMAGIGWRKKERGARGEV